MVGELRWLGPADDPRLWTLPERGWRATDPERWTLRLVDLPAALEARGDDPRVQERLEVEVDDPVLTENAGAPTWTADHW